MGAFIEINDTLRINKDQGFPTELNIEIHKKIPYKFEDFKEKIYSFSDKPKIRVYKIPPVRNFLVEDIDGKWLYWGLCHIITINHDYQKQVTSGKFKITYINTLEDMRKAHELIDRNPETNYFS